MSYTPRLKKKYDEEVVPAMIEKYNYSSIMAVPKLVKIALNQGVNGATSDKKLVDIAVKEMSEICGQKATDGKSNSFISPSTHNRVMQERRNSSERQQSLRFRV